MGYSVQEKNKAILSYMGGISFIKNISKTAIKEEDLLVLGTVDSTETLMFHKSWDWLMPVWGKVNQDLLGSDDQGAMLYAMSKSLDSVNIEAFHSLISKHCVQWCINKQIDF